MISTFFLGQGFDSPQFYVQQKRPASLQDVSKMYWGFSMEKLRRQDSNLRPSGYEPDELPLLYLAMFSDQAVTPGRREMYTEEVYTPEKL